jgi:hypothetical protein
VRGLTRVGPTTTQQSLGTSHGHCHDERRHGDSIRTAARESRSFSSWMAAVSRRLGRSNDVFRWQGLSRNCSRSSWPRSLDPDRYRSRYGYLRGRCFRASLFRLLFAEDIRRLQGRFEVHSVRGCRGSVCDRETAHSAKHSEARSRPASGCIRGRRSRGARRSRPAGFSQFKPAMIMRLFSTGVEQKATTTAML